MATTKKKTASPLGTVKDKFSGKEQLVDRILALLPSEEDATAAKTRLLAVSNKKLLRLAEVASEIKSKYGSPEKLAEATAAAVGKAKDQAYVARLAKLAHRTPARVLDLLRAATARTKAA